MRNLIACAIAILLVICTTLLGPISNGSASRLPKEALYDAVARPEIPLVNNEEPPPPEDAVPKPVAKSPDDAEIMYEDGTLKSSPTPTPSPAPVPAAPSPSPAPMGTDQVQNLLEVHWDNAQSGVKICRIHKACVSSDGNIQVPAWMKQYSAIISACGMRNVVYSGKISQNPENKFDLFGSAPLRWHMPHFTTDLLAVLYAKEVVRPVFTKSAWKSHTYYTKKGVSKKGVLVNVKPAVYADQRISSFNRYAWVPQVLARLPNDPTIVYPPAGGKLKCFRSIIAFDSKSYLRQSSIWYGPKNAFFSKRTSIFNVPIPKDSPDGCKIKVTIINRKGTDMKSGLNGKKYQMGRDMINVDEFVAELRLNPMLDVTVAYFDHASFKYQVENIEKSDIIVGTHGGGLANILFARRDVPFIELFPWGYKPDMFQTLARALFLSYRSFESIPELTFLKECLESTLENNKDPELTKWKLRTIDAAKTSASFNSAQFPANLLLIKFCVRSQRIQVDVKRLSSLVVREANTICRNRAAPK